MSKNIKRVTVVGAGEAAQMFILTVKSSAKFSNQYNFVSIFDDDKKKINSTIDKIKILDNIKNIGKYKDSFDKIVIAIPSASKSDFNRIYDICLKTNKEILTIPSLREILDKSKSITSVRDIDIKDLIERDEISINYNEISKIVSNKTILITGGAGSIGSVILELCLIGKAKKIICIDNSEYNTYSLLNKISNRKLICKVSDIRDIKMMDFYFHKYKPEIVFHAAALKHLNLQENNLRDCLITNFFGTENILKLVKKYSVNNFVLISTDKAVEPSNNMGLSKRMAEFIVYYYADILKTKMSVVRFGNVIGSSGSVLNYFSSLIKSKKNITITDPKVSRFFMSIEEACYLVLHSIINTKKNFQIFMLDMGKEILISDIAKKLISLNNLVLGEDIDIEYTTLSKGEKLREKLKYNFEKMLPTKTEKLIKLDSSKKIDIPNFEKFIDTLEIMIYKKNISDKKIIIHIKKYFRDLI